MSISNRIRARSGMQSTSVPGVAVREWFSFAMNRSSAVLIVLLAATAIALLGCGGSDSYKDSGDDTGELGRNQKESPAEIYVKLGIAYMREGQYAVALRKLKQGLEADPKSAEAHNVIALLYERLGELHLAQEHYARAVQLEPENPFVRNAWGSFLCQQKKYAEAEEQFKRAVQNPLYPTPWVATTNAGLCARRAGDSAKAEQYFRQALSVNARFPVALHQMAELSYEQDNYLSSRAYLQRYLAVADHTARTLWLAVRIEDRLGDQNAVASHKMLLRAKFPDAPEVQLLREYEQQ